MHKFFVNKMQVNNNEIVIVGQDVNHIKNVLRLDINDEIQICCKDCGSNYNCIISGIDNDRVICEIENREECKEERVYINIFQGLPKFDKMEWVIEKNTELGVTEITPVEMRRSIVKLDSKTREKKLERWRKIAETAAKQSKRNIIPVVNSVIDINELITKINDYDIFIVAYEEEKKITLKDELKTVNKDMIKVGVAIGPEGGFDPEEIEKLKNSGAKVITLGSRILRTETASMAITSMIMYEFDNMNY